MRVASIVTVLSLAWFAMAGDLQKTLVNGTTCLDGSPAGYFIALGETNDWAIYLQGGGDCYDLEDCAARAKSPLGSSTYWPSSWGAANQPTDPDCTVNPIWCKANRVFVPYCTGDVHAGGRTSAFRFPSSDEDFYFSGHLNLMAILRDLQGRHNIVSAKSLLLTGASAGGMGTFANADAVGRFLSNSTKFRAVPQGGWFFPNVTTFPDWVAGKSGLPFNPAVSELYNLTGTLSAKCQAEHGDDAFYCFTLDTMYQYVETPLLVAENTADSQQIHTELLMPSKASSPEQQKQMEGFTSFFQERMIRSVEQVREAQQSGRKPIDAVWMPACFDHVGDLNFNDPGLTVQGATMLQAVQKWWNLPDDGTSDASDLWKVAQCALDNPDSLPCSAGCSQAPPVAVADSSLYGPGMSEADRQAWMQ